MDKDQVIELLTNINHAGVHENWDEIMAQYAKVLMMISGKVTTAELATFIALGRSIYWKSLGDKLGDM